MILKWKVSRRRKLKRSGVHSPVKASKYMQFLSSKGAGFREQKRNRAGTKGLQLDDKRD